MLFFGHIGITIGIGKGCDTVLTKADSACLQKTVSDLKPLGVNSKRPSKYYDLLGRIKKQIGQIDYRLVMFGSILPDIIDKPIFMLNGNASLSGRDYAHTLLFSTVLLIGGLILISYRKSWLLVISLSSFTHLVFDRMWNNHVTLFWPMLGPLVGGDRNAFLPDVFFGLFTPEVYIPEIIGLIILFYYAFRVVKRKAVKGFIRNGILD